MRKFNFTNRVISVWTTLPDTVVSANTIDTFKARLDRSEIQLEIRYYNRKSKSSQCYYRVIIYCLSYAHDIMIWITRSLDLHSDNIITTTTITSASVARVWRYRNLIITITITTTTTTTTTI